MKWDCESAPVSNVPGTEYRGHVLARATEIVDGESRTPWVGWRCVHCGDRFALPGEADRYDLPLMERVDVEELPTEAREAAAVALACAASTIEHDAKVIEPIGHYTDHVNPIGWARAHHSLCCSSHEFGRAWYAEGEALIRNGEV